MPAFPSSTIRDNTGGLSGRDLRPVLQRKRVLGVGFAVVVLMWAALHPPTHAEAYPPGTLRWNGVDEIA